MRLPYLSALVLLAALAGSRTANAQRADSIPFAPGVTITATQRLMIDSLVQTYREEVRAAASSDSTRNLSQTARRGLRRKYQAAIGAVLTPAERAAYDAWFAQAEAAFEGKRPPGSGGAS